MNQVNCKTTPNKFLGGDSEIEMHRLYLDNYYVGIARIGKAGRNFMEAKVQILVDKGW